LTGAAITVLALAEPFIAAGAAVGLFGVVYCFLKVLMVSSYRLGIGTFLLQKKVKPPRNEIMNGRQLNPGTGKLISMLNKSSIH
jgi:hypothetical protein